MAKKCRRVEHVVKNILSEQKIEEKFKDEDDELVLPNVPDHTPKLQIIDRQVLRKIEDETKKITR